MRRTLQLLLILASIACLSANPAQKGNRLLPAAYNDPWYRAGQQTLQQIRGALPIHASAKNVIIFVGDGLGINSVTAARILEGQLRGEPGEENLLSFEKLPYTALAKTYNVNAQVPDSAGTASAIMTGVKTKAGVISVDQDVIPLDHTTVQGNAPRTLLEIAESWGMSTGVITTSTVTDATPAAAYAHAPHRYWQNDAQMSEAARSAGFFDIARQLVEFRGNGLEVAMGGGRVNFMQSTVPDPEETEKKGGRTDGRDLIRQWMARPRSAYVWNKAQFEAVDPAATDHLLGLFSNFEVMKAEVDRTGDAGGEPSLAEMTSKAIDILSKNREGFVLLVEEEWIDEAHHLSNAYRALDGVISLARAVDVALRKTNSNETLVIVTGDHSHMFVAGGFSTRGNPILGKVVGNRANGTASTEFGKDVNGLPFTTLVYGTGSGYRSPRQDLTNVDTSAPDYRQESAIPTNSEFHAMDDVPVYAGGPGAFRFHGVIEQNVIFHLILDAMTSK